MDFIKLIMGDDNMMACPYLTGKLATEQLHRVNWCGRLADLLGADAYGLSFLDRFILVITGSASTTHLLGKKKKPSPLSL